MRPEDGAESSKHVGAFVTKFNILIQGDRRKSNGFQKKSTR